MRDAPRRLAGRYELIEVIGRGGMGAVYRARDLTLERVVAVKVLPAALAEGEPTHITRFTREARAAASLSHAGVVAVYDTGADDGTRFIVMEHVAGRSLAMVLHEDAPLEPVQAAHIAQDMADALGAAHDAGIVHRDVKPSNVMIADDGTVKVLDFGIARSHGTTTLTNGSSVLGSAAYMAPEQAVGARADHRSDIYSLGCVLYALLTGQPPFTGDNAAAVMQQQINSAPLAPGLLNSRIPPALDELVLEMLAKSPALRPQSAAELRDRLGAAAASPARARASTATATTAATAVLRRSAAEPPPVGSNRPHRLALAAGLGAVALVIALVLLASSGGSGHAPAASARVRATSKAKPSSAAHPSAAPSATSSARVPAPTASAPVTSVSAAAGALTSLLAADLESGTVDRHAAQQISTALASALGAYGGGQPLDAAAKLADLAGKLGPLEANGDINPAAAPRIREALGSLGSALSGPTPPPAPTTAAEESDGASGAPPPGHRGHGKGKGD
jgi:serine/threonine protein kinase